LPSYPCTLGPASLISIPTDGTDEAGIRAYGEMNPAATQPRARSHAARRKRMVPALNLLPTDPVLALTVTRAGLLSDGITRYELRRPSRADLPRVAGKGRI